MVLFSSRKYVTIPEISFYHYNDEVMKDHSGRTAMVNATSKRSISFDEVRQATIKLASALTRKGLNKQEIVALSTSNCIEYPLIILGVSACNAITTTCNPRYTLEETQKQFENCQPKFIITDSDQVDKMLEIAKKVSSIQEVISVDDSNICDNLWNIICNDDGKRFPVGTTVDVHKDVVLLPYSSGTTGMPKGVMLTHYNFVSLLSLMSEIGRPRPSLTTYSVIPMFHAYGLLRIFSLLNGVTHIIDKRFHIKNFLEAVEKYKVNVFFAVPAIFQEISNSPLVDKYDTSSLLLLGSGAAPLPSVVKASAAKKTGAPIVQGWGLTESIVICTLPKDASSTKGVGYLIPNTKLKVVDPETRKELGVGQDGEMLVQGPQVMKGYFKNERATSATFEDGWLCTGDIGHYDDKGMVYVVDRMKELIKYKGFQVAPAELENILLHHPKVADAGVVGVADVEAGEVPRAFIVKKDPTLTAVELNLFVQGQVSKYKYLRGGIKFIEEIPRSTTGKILRRKLKTVDMAKL